MVGHSKTEKIIRMISIPVGFVAGGQLAVGPTESAMLTIYYKVLNAISNFRLYAKEIF